MYPFSSYYSDPMYFHGDGDNTSNCLSAHCPTAWITFIITQFST